MHKKQISFPDIADIEKTNKIATDLFGIEEDKTQVKPTLETALKLISIDKYNFVCFKEGDEVVAWSVVLPTSKKAMDDFLEEKKNEKELFELFLEKPSFEALYLAAVIVVPKHQKKGLGLSLMKEQINYFKENHGINNFFTLILSKEGKRFMENIQKDSAIKVLDVSRV
ncbi:hypothetical protein A2442_02675 [Candidatus Campbellbacteria bacterium RIFOXYC2_FULL_35_25]|uniref:N-acetyltransferase domain-containing protein n=1 Tax=Candidatus Campbellbacteria bacterium RIFOXYC2_FULL_35_25 TaxID=1797582 RepID=A0A1F5EJK5_9BACT|nr:MAG: hypothetical protein A2442_02675 [Candidatus Campbellbacteria bacterium RIFOXYC2_FULL_35_25]